MKRRPLGGGGADRIDQGQDDSPVHTRSAPDPQDQRCAGCGAAGHAPTIVWDKTATTGTILVPVFGWHADGRPALLCPRCKGNLRKRRGRARYSKGRPTDGRLVDGDEP